MTPEEFAKSINIPYKDHYPGLECPNCNKYGIAFDEDMKAICPYCKEEYLTDDLCAECQKLVKGSCYYCKMD